MSKIKIPQIELNDLQTDSEAVKIESITITGITIDTSKSEWLNGFKSELHTLIEKAFNSEHKEQVYQFLDGKAIQEDFKNKFTV